MNHLGCVPGCVSAFTVHPASHTHTHTHPPMVYHPKNPSAVETVLHNDVVPLANCQNRIVSTEFFRCWSIFYQPCCRWARPTVPVCTPAFNGPLSRLARARYGSWRGSLCFTFFLLFLFWGMFLGFVLCVLPTLPGSLPNRAHGCLSLAARAHPSKRNAAARFRLVSPTEAPYPREPRQAQLFGELFSYPCHARRMIAALYSIKHFTVEFFNRSRG